MNQKSILKFYFKVKNYDHLSIIAYFLVSLIILREVIFSPGTVGFFHDWFIGPYQEMNNIFANGGFYILDPQVGNKLYPTDWIFRIAVIPFSFLNGEELSKGLLILVVTLSGYSTFILGRQFKLTLFSSFVAGILYIFSPIVYTRIVAGHLYYLIAYSLSPLILSNFLKGVDEDKRKYFIISGILISFAAIQLQFLIMLFIVLLIFSIIDFKNIRKSATGIFIIFSIVILSNLLPIILSQNLYIDASGTPFDSKRLLSYHGVISASDIMKSIRLIGYDIMPYGYTNLSREGIIPSWILYLDYLFPIIGLLTIYLRRDKYAISFAIISMIGIFLLKGSNPPFGDVFSFIFINGFYMFREIWHIAFLYGLSLTFLITFFVEYVLLNVKNRLKVVFLLFIISIIVISNGYPMLIGNFGGYLQTYNFPEEYYTVYKNFSMSKDYNILILPSISPIKFDDLKLNGIDPLIKYSQNSIFDQQMGTPSPTRSVSSWMIYMMQENRTDRLGNLLSGFGIKYIILRRDFTSKYPHYIPLWNYRPFIERWNVPLEHFLDSQKDLVVISNTTYYKIYKNINDAHKFFIPTTFAGGFSDFNTLLLISNFTPLSNIGMYPHAYNKEDIILLDSPGEIDKYYDNFIDLGRYTDAYDANKGWTTNRYWFGYNYILASRNYQGAFTRLDNATFSFELDMAKYKDKPIELWLKALKWPRGGNIYLNINGEDSSYDLFSWNYSLSLIKIFEGRLNVSHIPFSIRNVYGENYIEGMYIKDDLNKINDRDLLDKIAVSSIYGKETNMVYNSDFTNFSDGQYLPLYWYDNWKNCNVIFKCAINFTEGWNDNISFQISTTSNKPKTWSWIYGKEIIVDKDNEYDIVTHMYVDNNTVASHIPIEGFDEISKEWYQMMQCPTAVNGSLEWKEFRCTITIPENVDKIRPVLNSGWASQENTTGRTLFGDTRIFKLDKNVSVNITNADLEKLITYKKYAKIDMIDTINPTLYKMKINSTGPFMLAFAESYDHLWTVSIDKIDGKLIDHKDIYAISLYSVINGFWIDQPGNLDITISYEPQKWFEVGLIISSIMLISCIGYLLYDYRRKIHG